MPLRQIMWASIRSPEDDKANEEFSCVRNLRENVIDMERKFGEAAPSWHRANPIRRMVQVEVTEIPHSAPATPKKSLAPAAPGGPPPKRTIPLKPMAKKKVRR